MKKLELDSETIVRLYTEEYLSAPDIAAIYNIGHNTVYRLLRDKDIKIRSISNSMCRGKFNGLCNLCGISISCKLTCKKCSYKSFCLKNKEKLAVYSAKYREKAKDTEKYKSYFKEYAKKHKERIRESKRINKSKRREIIKNGSLTILEWINILNSQNGICFYCKKQSNMTIDHIIPLCKGGPHSKENVCGACLSCNIKKNTKSAEEWFRIIGA